MFSFSSRIARHLWWALFLSMVPLSLYLRFHFLNNSLIEPHPIRQCQTGLTIQQLAHGTGSVLDYSSPLGGRLWNFVIEFPLYQWIAAKVMTFGLPLEVSGRLVSLFFFFAGFAVFCLILFRHLDREIALWGALFYLISPFNIIFSRSVLIDFTALFFVLGLSACFLEIYRRETGYWFLCFLALGTVSGILGSVTKVSVWYAPVTALFLYGVWLLFKAPHKRRVLAACLASLILQLAVASAWILWAGQVRSHSGFLHGQDWLFGPLANRLNLWQWDKILFGFIGQFVLHYWMMIPFIVGLASTKHRVLVATCAMLFLVPVTVMFNVHTYHDYYLIAVIPFILTIAAVGMKEISHFQKGTRAIVFGALALCFVHRIPRLPALFSTIFFDYRPQVEAAIDLKRHSSPKDLIAAVDTGPEAWEVPLYSERLVLVGDRNQLPGLDFSLLRLPSAKASSFLNSIPALWIEGDLKNPLYRIKEVDGFRFNSDKQIGLSDTGPGEVLMMKVGEARRFNGCKTSSTYTVVQIQGEASELSVVSDEGVVKLPAKRFLSLPFKGQWGCDLLVAVN